MSDTSIRFPMPGVRAGFVLRQTITPGTIGFVIHAYGSPSSPNAPSWAESLFSLADVGHAGTAEPTRVHGQRPWFQSVMRKRPQPFSDHKHWTIGVWDFIDHWDLDIRISLGFRVSGFLARCHTGSHPFPPNDFGRTAPFATPPSIALTAFPQILYALKNFSFSRHIHCY